MSERDIAGWEDEFSATLDDFYEAEWHVRALDPEGGFSGSGEAEDERHRAWMRLLKLAKEFRDPVGPDGRTEGERWKAAAIQAKDDLRAVEAGFRDSTPIGEDGPNPPLGPGCVFAQWSSPAVTMRWIEGMQHGEVTDEARRIWALGLREWRRGREEA